MGSRAEQEVIKPMGVVIGLIVAVVIICLFLAMALKIVTQYERGVLFRLGRVIGTKEPGLHVIMPVIDRLNDSLT